MDPEQRQTVLVDWNRTQSTYPCKYSMAELFEAEAQKREHAVAIECEEGQLSYQELNKQANQLAHYLRSIGVATEELVGICLERSLNMVIALLGILKAGAAYVPMDAGWPAERLRWITEDCNLRVNVTAEKLLQASGQLHETRTVCLDRDLRQIARQDFANPSHLTNGRNLAYVMYTSGSTGRPKGVAVEQRSVVRLVRNTNYVKLGPEEVLLQLAPIFFDASTFEMWGALLNGGKLVLAPAQPLSSREIGQIIRTHQVTTLWLTANLFHRMVEDSIEDLRPLRQVLAGGDVLLPASVRKASGASLVINGYGPTENTTFTSCFPVTDLLKIQETVPIGKPVANTQIYILDEQMEPVAVGATGELYAGGDGLSRGYLNHPDLTAEKFLPNPWSGRKGERLYRTGDRARWLPDGNIEFLGRTDHQVKIRGYRVEIGELEAVLSQHPSVQTAIVVAREHRPGEKSLAAYLVACPGQKADISDLRSYLAHRLPDYMLPSQFVFLEQFPLTPTGKVDRQELCMRDETKPVLPPTSTVEKALADICSEVLGRSAVSLDSTFIELGGSSLDATRLISAIRNSVSGDLPMKDLFSAKTLRELAVEVAACVPSSLRRRRKPGETRYPASASQERVWFIHQIDPSTLAYHFSARITFSGDLNVRALSSTLSTIVERHEIYRTTFDHSSQQLLQIIHPPWNVELEIIDATQQEDLPENVLHLESRTPFDLKALPLVRWKLVRVHAHKHILIAVEHHLVHDGWSFNVFLKEVTELYRAGVQGSVPALSPSPLQFAEFAQWEKEWLESSDASRQLEYWKKTLAGVPPLAGLPFDYPRATVQTYKGGMEILEIDQVMLNDLHSLALRQQATLFMVFFAAFQIVLFRYSGQKDFCIGTGIANRRWHETKDLIGMLVNNIGLRTRIDASFTIEDIIHRAKHTTLEAYAHQEMPFDRIVHAVCPSRDPSHNPIFQAAISFHDSPVECATLEQMSLDVEVGLSNGAAKFDLNVVVIPPQIHNLSPGRQPSTRMLWEYNASLFAPATIQRMKTHYNLILGEILRDLKQRVSELCFLAQEETAQVLYEWNPKETMQTPETCIHKLIEDQTSMAPQRVAIEHEGRQLSYAGLNRRSNKLAHYLRSIGVGPEVRIGVMLERSLDLITGLLAVLKAGGAYVPLDPAEPLERLEYMLRDADIFILLTTAKLHRYPQKSRTRTCYLDTEWMEIAEHRDSDPGPSASANNLACVIYTSGSTGNPKGAMIQHSNLANLVTWHHGAYQLQPADQITQIASVSFDALGWEIWPCLAAGATLHIAPDETRFSPDKLWKWICKKGITVCFLPTPLAEAFLSTTKDREHDHCAMRALLTGGDRLRSFLLHDFEFQLFNHYGPTENTVVSTWSLVNAGLAGPPSIGRPITNTQAFILDDALQPVPVGVAGEIYLGGANLARGYLARPELTAEMFLPNPFSSVSGARLYRTGDRAKWLTNGDIQFLGRSDEQVKVRGFRIEPAEIETAIRTYPGIRECAVSAIQEDENEKKIVAYLAAEEGVDVEGLRSYLRQHLPGYMIPAQFMVLQRLPLNANGKLDRNALPPPPRPAPDARRFVPPGSELQRMIAELWSQTLQISTPGAHDNFFDLGGHSLLLAGLHTKMEAVLGRQFPLVKLFEYPTIASLADYFGNAANAKTGTRPQAFHRGANRTTGTSGEIAIIGMSCRYPGAGSLREFWHNLTRGIETVSSLSEEELAALPPERVQKNNFVNAVGRLVDLDLFDSAFFGMNPAEAAATDPQQRLLLECAWEALESAGHGPGTGEEKIGVFAGAGESRYRDLLRADRALVELLGEMQLLIGTGKDHIATRLSYLFNLKGPSVPVNTACSTSLVAVHLACQSLLNRECELAIAGASSVAVKPDGYFHEKGGILSADGHCRAFDKSAAGTVPSSGVGVVVLRRLEEALTHGDHIHAVIKGSAINNDGAAKVGYTAPSVEGQREVIKQALHTAAVQPEEISYIEAHGTGTALGDQIEVEALRQVFGEDSAAETCALGAVKTNIGHCDAAAGMAGLIKTVLCLENQMLVPTLHFQQPNPNLHFDKGPLYVIQERAHWDRTPRLAGVSSFGIGGTNAHVILSEAPQQPVSDFSRPWQLITVSARTEPALQRRKVDLAKFLNENPTAPFADIVFSSNSGRKPFAIRQSFTCRSAEEATRILCDGNGKAAILDSSIKHSVIFLFPGQGTAYKSLGQDIYREESRFREEVDRCSIYLRSVLNVNLSEILFGNELHHQLYRPSLWQLALFVVDYAMARLWMSWGITPIAMIGHSLGEYVAATLAGVLELEDALALVAERGRLTEKLLPGTMLALHATESQIQPYLGSQLSVASINGPALCVVSGPDDEINRIESELAHYHPVRLAATHAFHSSMVEPVMQPLTQFSSRFRLRPPSIPYLSNVSGTWATEEQVTNPAYWAQHLRQAVRFYDCLREVAQKTGRILLEVGPGHVLTDLARGNFSHIPAFPSLSGDEPDSRAIAAALGNLWNHGVEPDWSEYYKGQKRRRVLLPTYPFERRSCWVQERPSLHSNLPMDDACSKPENWLYLPSWKRVASQPAEGLKKQLVAPERWLLFMDEGDLSRELAGRLHESGQIVFRGSSFKDLGNGRFTIAPSEPDGYRALFNALRAAGKMPERILHSWCIERHDPGDETPPAFLGIESLLHLARALSSFELDKPLPTLVLTTNNHQVFDEIKPELCTAGIPDVIYALQHNTRVITRHIDIDVAEDLSPKLLTDKILAGFATDGPHATLAFRRGHLWTPVYDRILTKDPQDGIFTQGGVYVITNALQEIGIHLAERLVHQCGARVVLADLSFFPPADEWERWVMEQGENDFISDNISRLQTIRHSISIVAADLGHRDQVLLVRQRAEQEFGKVTGVFHLEKPESRTRRISTPLGAKLQATLAEQRILERGFAETDLLVLFSTNLAACIERADVERAARTSLLSRFAGQAVERGKRVVNIQWDAAEWNKAEAPVVNQDPPQNQQLHVEIGIEDCFHLVQRALALRMPDVVVSTRNFGPLLEKLARAVVCPLETPKTNFSKLPISANGHLRPQLSTAYEAPRNEIEDLIVELWKAALGFQLIGIRDNFFELGGHSLLAVQVVRKINETFSSEVTLRDFFDVPSVAQLAVTICSKSPDEKDAEALNAVLSEIEALSDNEVRSALREQAEQAALSKRIG